MSRSRLVGVGGGISSSKSGRSSKSKDSNSRDMGFTNDVLLE